MISRSKFSRQVWLIGLWGITVVVAVMGTSSAATAIWMEHNTTLVQVVDAKGQPVSDAVVAMERLILR